MNAKTKKNKGKGIKLKISPLFILLALFFMLSEKWLYFLIYIISTLAHEFAHAVIAKSLGYKLSSVKLMPYGVALEGEFVAIPSPDEILIALSGPLFNLFVSLLTPTAWYLFPRLYGVIKTVGAVNLTLFAINLIPAYPLDGGRVLLALMSKKSSRAIAYRRARTVSLAIGITTTTLALITLPIVLNPTILTFCAFIILSSVLPDGSYYESIFRVESRLKRIKNGLAVREILVDKNTTVKEMKKHLTVNFYTCFIVVDERLIRRFAISETTLDRASGSDYLLTAEKFHIKMSQN